MFKILLIFSVLLVFITANFDGKIMTGKDFNKIFGKEKLVKFTNFDEHHYGMKYSDGLNMDIKPFIPGDICGPGGIYFTLKKYEMFWIGILEKWEREVIIPDYATVQVFNKKFKTDMIILNPRNPISNETQKKLREKMYKTNFMIFEKSQ